MILSRLSAVCALAAIVFCLSTQARPDGAGTPLDNREHPRLWLSSSTIPEIRARLAGPLKGQYQTFVQTLDAEYNSVAGTSDYYFGIRNYGFVYAIGPVSGISYGHSQAQYGAKAVELLRAFSVDSRGVAGSEGDAPVHLFAAGYDWLFPLLGGSDRQTIVSILKSGVGKANGPGFNRNSFHHREIKDRMLYILVGLIYANDGIDDADANTRLNEYASYIAGDGGTLAAANMVASNDGGVSVGTSYAVNGVGDGLEISSILFSEAWRTSHGLSRDAVFGGNNDFRYFPQWIAYMVMPWDGSGGPVLYPTHEMDRGSPARGFFDLPVTLSSLRIYKDVDPRMAGLAEWLTQNQTGAVPLNGVVGRRSAVTGNFLFNPGDVEPLSPSALNLPLSKLFKGLGWLAMRTGWSRRDDTVVTLSASPFTRKPSYANVDQGGFTIDRNGPLAINAGAGIHHSFIEISRAYNTIMFTDPNEPIGSWPEYWDRGGQRGLFAIPVGVSAITKNSQWDIGGVKRSDLHDGTAAHDYDYVYADVTRAYNGPANFDAYNTQKVTLFSRQLVYFRRTDSTSPDRIVVFDRTETTGTQFEKRWQFHPPGRADGARSFVISGHSGVAPGPARAGSMAGKQTFSQPSLITVTNTDGGSNGRLFWQPLLPASRKIVEVGGPDTNGRYGTAGSHEFEEPYGYQVSDSGSYQIANAQYVGHYTLELQPANKSLSDIFLNVLEATTPSQAAPSATMMVSGSRTVGALVGDRIAVFNRSEGYIANDTVSIPRAGTYRVLISDLQPGMNYNINGSVVDANSSGTAYVTLSSGTLSIASTGSVTVVAPSAPTNVRILK